MSLERISQGDMRALRNEIMELRRRVDKLSPSVKRLTVQTGSTGTASSSRRVLQENTTALTDRDALNFGTGLTATDKGSATNRVDVDVDASGIDHGGLTGLGDDDHTQYGHLSQTETVLARWTFGFGATMATSQPLILLSDVFQWELSADTDNHLQFSDGVANRVIFRDGGDVRILGLTSATIVGTDANGTLIAAATADTRAEVSPLTTKGDLWGYDTADNRLPVGANGSLLQADSGEALGVGWDTTLTGTYTLSNSGTVITVPTGDIQIDQGELRLDNASGENCLVIDVTGSTATLGTRRGVHSGNFAFWGLGAAPAASGGNSARIYASAFSSQFNSQNSDAHKIVNAVLNVNRGASSAANTGVFCQVDYQSSVLATGGNTYGGEFKCRYNTTVGLPSSIQFVGGKFIGDTTGSSSGSVACGIGGGRFSCEIKNAVTSTTNPNYAGRFNYDQTAAATTTDAWNAWIATSGNQSAGTITNLAGLRIDDLSGETVNPTNAQAVWIDAQDDTNQAAGKWNIYCAGGNYNTGHLQMENGHVWNDATNNCIRFDGAAPSAETSGVGFLTAGETGAQTPTLNTNLPAAAAGTANATWLPVYIGATKGWIPVWQ